MRLPHNLWLVIFNLFVFNFLWNNLGIFVKNELLFCEILVLWFIQQFFAWYKLCWILKTLGIRDFSPAQHVDVIAELLYDIVLRNHFVNEGVFAPRVVLWPWKARMAPLMVVEWGVVYSLVDQCSLQRSQVHALSQNTQAFSLALLNLHNSWAHLHLKTLCILFEVMLSPVVLKTLDIYVT